jgi:hypothetical protein
MPTLRLTEEHRPVPADRITPELVRSLAAAVRAGDQEVIERLCASVPTIYDGEAPLDVHEVTWPEYRGTAISISLTQLGDAPAAVDRLVRELNLRFEELWAAPDAWAVRSTRWAAVEDGLRVQLIWFHVAD